MLRSPGEGQALPVQQEVACKANGRSPLFGTQGRMLRPNVLVDQLGWAALHEEVDPPHLAVDGLGALGLDDAYRYSAMEQIDILLHPQWSLLSSIPAASTAEGRAVVPPGSPPRLDPGFVSRECRGSPPRPSS